MHRQEVIFNSQLPRYIVFDFFSGSSCETKNGNFGEACLQQFKVKIVLTEVLSPVRDTVHFINYESINLVL